MITQFWHKRPLVSILIIALLIRLIAVVFSKGFGMHDDHFIVIESAASWVDGYDYNNWLPKNSINGKPGGHSFFYPGLHYLFFSLLKSIGIVYPQTQMFFVRLLHALFSLLIVFYGFKIAYFYTNLNRAKQVGLVLALFWAMPFLSVRNLVEIACIPFMFIGYWLLIKPNSKILLNTLLAGILFGLSISIRFQCYLIVGGIGLVFLFQKQWLKTFMFGLGSVILFALVQGGIDYAIWGYPFAEFIEYINHNLVHKFDYIVGEWYNYLLLIIGILIPPFSIVIFWSYLKTWRKYLILFFPTLIFLIFHSYFPNKQERFILPIVPLLLLQGIIGLETIPAKYKKFISISWKTFWIINLILLPIITLTYSKKSRVEAMEYLYDKKATYVISEDINHDEPKMYPRYYSGKWLKIAWVSKKYPFQKHLKNNKPEYILFSGAKNIDTRVKSMKNNFPQLAFEKKIEPGFIDKLMHWLNPVNENVTVYIYRTQYAN